MKVVHTHEMQKNAQEQTESSWCSASGDRCDEQHGKNTQPVAEQQADAYEQSLWLWTLLQESCD